MSRAMWCDNCGEVLGPLNQADTERVSAVSQLAGWVVVVVGSHEFDCCSRACARSLLDDDTRFDDSLEVGK